MSSTSSSHYGTAGFPQSGVLNELAVGRFILYAIFPSTKI